MASGIMRKAMVFLGLDDDDYDDVERYDEVAVSPSRRYAPEPAEVTPQPLGIRPLARESAISVQDPSGGVTVTPRPVVRAIPNPSQAVKVHVVAPMRFSDAQEVGDRFKSGQPVIVNLQTGDAQLSRRMIDFCSGVTYALSGSMDKVAEQVFLLTPTNVEVPAEEKRRLQEKGLFQP